MSDRTRFFKFVAPVLLVALVAFNAANSKQIVDTFSHLGKKEEAPSEYKTAIEGVLKKQDMMFKLQQGRDYLSPEVVDSDIAKMTTAKVLGSKELEFTGDVWVEKSGARDGKLYILKTTKLADTLSELDSLKFYYDKIAVNEKEGTVDVTVRLVEVRS